MIAQNLVVLRYIVIFFVLVGILLLLPDSFAVPPRERVPLENLTILDMGDSMTIKPNQQYTVRVDYQSNFP